METNVQYYYKLKQIDLDVHFKFSATVDAELNADDAPKVTECFPNPANGSSSIMIHASSESVFSFELYDITGKLIQQSSINAVPGYNRFDFITELLAQGSYKVVVKSQRSVFTRNLNILR
ncbi:MAG: T9SS type A sorting domain-containing protein [Bacteroidetes bacterium]|nr:T9SS type A sorting domain-containing protein [Bacteroidota bacterium]